MDLGPKLAPTANLRKPQRQGGPVLENPFFNWNTQDRYVELLNFEMEVANILEPKAHELTDKEKFQVLKN